MCLFANRGSYNTWIMVLYLCPSLCPIFSTNTLLMICSRHIMALMQDIRKDWINCRSTFYTSLFCAFNVMYQVWHTWNQDIVNGFHVIRYGVWHKRIFHIFCNGSIAEMPFMLFFVNIAVQYLNIQSILDDELSPN